MIILDTNIISACMRQTPDEAVLAWLDSQPSEHIWITSITVLEVRYGIYLLTPSKRRTALEEAFDAMLHHDLQNRILPFDTEAAEATAALTIQRKERGQIVDLRDSQIAGIALSRNATLATRNIRHFDDTSLTLINP